MVTREMRVRLFISVVFCKCVIYCQCDNISLDCHPKCGCDDEKLNFSEVKALYLGAMKSFGNVNSYKALKILKVHFQMRSSAVAF